MVAHSAKRSSSEALHDAGTGTARPHLLARWLFIVAGLVIAIVTVGGITRLTESGLSITEWKPFLGALPPMNEADWQAEFELYKQIPEYTQINGPAGMDLAAFKTIYFWEWVHRQMGRVIGLALLLPFLWFWLRGAIPAGYKLRIGALVALVGLQGSIGWWMVASGLEARTDVSHFRLSVHLLTALFLLGGLVWTALDLRRFGQRPARFTGLSIAVLAVLFIQLLLGAWVAGLNAGLASDTWPAMQGQFVPEFDTSRGALWALTHDPFLLHWLHRWWAFVALAALIVIARKVKPVQRGASIALNATVGVQVILGILTVLSGVAIWIAVAHQTVGALLVVAFAWAAHALGRQE
ncbi:COX15/CtaA family protein [Paraurantiacibacter namhicola]|uniref:Heme A synthase n=1 Tax=Paraurantiacibacter namhicola TaxID=645517 RepID=A0A1C7D5Q1_9SPHN|nr:COX15/CtaA family protein [Paraurantiacibacter namhicola]ANU06785.1 Heme A synthase [Paraurantiacibacter namhicola]